MCAAVTCARAVRLRPRGQPVLFAVLEPALALLRRVNLLPHSVRPCAAECRRSLARGSPTWRRIDDRRQRRRRVPTSSCSSCPCPTSSYPSSSPCWSRPFRHCVNASLTQCQRIIDEFDWLPCGHGSQESGQQDQGRHRLPWLRSGCARSTRRRAAVTRGRGRTRSGRHPHRTQVWSHVGCHRRVVRPEQTRRPATLPPGRR